MSGPSKKSPRSPLISTTPAPALLVDDGDDESLVMEDSSGAPRAANEPLPENERPFGRYMLLRRLAFGGMGEIFLAR
ncbi:MAG TPA: hypothetical protein VGO62_14400, partial [Myxococcota bacterium]